MGICNDDHVAMLAEEIQAQYRRLFEVGDKLAQARKSLWDKDEELAKERADFYVYKSEKEQQLRDALHALSDRDIEIERLRFALKDKDEEIERLTTELNDVKGLYNNRLKIEEFQEEEIERLKRKNKKRVKVAELRWLLDGHTNVLDEHRTAILSVREAIDQNRETASVAQRVMLVTLDRHDGLISKAFTCIDNHSDSIYKQQQSIDNLWLYVESIVARINTGSAQENP